MTLAPLNKMAFNTSDISVVMRVARKKIWEARIVYSN